MLDAALCRVAVDGHALTIADVAGALGGPIGSIYHRFPSRDALLVRLWLRSVARFQSGLFALADISPPERVLIEAARHVPRYCRDHPDEARALTLYRQDRLLRDCPSELRDAVGEVNTDLEALTRRFARQRFGRASRDTLRLVVLAVRVCPYGLVRPYLGGPIPTVIDDAVEAAAGGILALGDR